jgi:hypothetical protein
MPGQEAQEQKLLRDFEVSPRFDAGDAALIEYLDANGYVVVKNAADSGQLEALTNELWNFLEAATVSQSHPNGWRRGEPESWDDDGMAMMGMGDLGILDGAGVGQSEFSWAVRTLPAVQDVFKLVWETEDLVTSFDGANVFRPWSVDSPANKTSTGWWHVDQGIAKVGSKQAIQGFVSLFDADVHTGGLCVVPNSHKRHAEVLAHCPGKGDFVCFNQGPRGRFPGFDELPHRLVACEAGDLVLWDSRTFHCNTPAIMTPRETGGELLRAVAYVCMTPAVKMTRCAEAQQDGGQHSDPTELNGLPRCCVVHQRRAGYEGRWTTSHWPHEFGPKAGGCESGQKYAAQSRLDLAALVPERRRLIDGLGCVSAPGY